MLSFADLKSALGDVLIGEIEQELTEIAREILSGEGDFLVGSGMSADAGVPTGGAVARELLRKHMFTGSARISEDELARLANSAPFEVIIGAIQAHLPAKRATLQDELKVLMRPSPAGVKSPAHAALAKLVQWDGDIVIRRIFTTNLELLIEEAVGETALPITEETANDYESALLDGRIPVLHIHGLVDKTFQMTEDETLASTSFRSVEAILMDRLYFSRVFCFVGYSMSDPDFRHLFARYRERLRLRQGHSKWTYVAYPVSSGAEYRLHRAIWEMRGAKYIPLTAYDFFRELGELLPRVRDEQDAELLGQYYGWSPTELASKVRKLREVLDLQEDPDAYAFLRELGPVRSGVVS